MQFNLSVKIGHAGWTSLLVSEKGTFRLVRGKGKVREALDEALEFLREKGQDKSSNRLCLASTRKALRGLGVPKTSLDVVLVPVKFHPEKLERA